MSQIKELIEAWFKKWDSGDFLNQPITADFSHTSPFGTIEVKKNIWPWSGPLKINSWVIFSRYMTLFSENNACVRYSAIQGVFTLDVSEWYYLNNGLIERIVAYYHIGEIRGDRQLSTPEE